MIDQFAGDREPVAVILAGIKDDRSRQNSRQPILTADQSMEELAQLARTLGWEPRGTVLQERDAPDPQTYLGKGKARELADLVFSQEASFVIIDGALSPAQARNLEELTGVPAMDRAELILRIFASRAMTREGKLQVELAATRHRLSRLAGYGT